MQKNKIIIEWHSILKDLLMNAWVVLLAALIGMMWIYIASYSVYSPEYTSSATLVVTAKSSASNPYSLVSISSEMAELLGMCDRIYVMNEGKIVGELDRPQFSQEAVMSCIMKSSSKEGATK